MLSLFSAGRFGRPALCIDAARPLEKIHEVVELGFTEIELRHLATPFDTGRLTLHPAFESLARARGIVFSTVTHPYVAELWSEVRPLTKNRVAVDAGVRLPDALAASDTRGEPLCIGRCGNGIVVALQGQSQKDRKKKCTSPVEDVPRGRLRQSFQHDFPRNLQPEQHPGHACKTLRWSQLAALGVESL